MARSERRDGYAHLFGDEKLKMFEGYGLDQAGMMATERLLETLAARMSRPVDWPGSLPGALKQDENPNLPSGYTYLAQLVGHDLTFNAIVTPGLHDDAWNATNLRGRGLQLETLYGGGPLQHPTLYQVGVDFGGRKPHLRLGSIGLKDPLLDPAERLRRARDIPRADGAFEGDARAGLNDALLADPRNDDQPTIAQVLVVFALLHNALCSSMTRGGGGRSAPDVFAAARAVVLVIYRRIIREDLLERLLNGQVYDRYVLQSVEPLHPREDSRITVEYAHAASRFGHAMIRPSYQFNKTGQTHGVADVVEQNSASRPYRMPLTPDWLIQWSQFFEGGTSAPSNLSRRLGPSLAEALARPGLFNGMGLPLRDLIRGSYGIRSIDSFRAVLPADIVGMSEFLSQPGEQAAAIAAFLDWPVPSGVPDLTVADKAVLARDPPLLFCILVEAAIYENGARLGVLGSVIIAETICAALLRSEAELPPEASLPDDGLARSLLNLPKPLRMRDLLNELDRIYDFAAGSYPFA